ncbi:hypothetical protein SFR_0117 [Streptomyces sp. FR-008]|nr:hypothetical protein SFR_0117 [Streptomyces sp. FR-008]
MREPAPGRAGTGGAVPARRSAPAPVGRAVKRGVAVVRRVQ